MKLYITPKSDLQYRSSHQRCSVKKGVLRNFTKFTGKHLRQSLFFNKIAGLRPATLLKKETLAQVFSCEFCEISKNAFSTEHPRTNASDNTLAILISTKKIHFQSQHYNYYKILRQDQINL